MTKIKPYPLQTKVLNLTKADIFKKKLIVVPCGIGKTYIAGFYSKLYPKKNILFLAHRQEILHQARDVFKKIIGNEKGFGWVIGGKKNNYNARIVFGSVLSVKKCLHRFKKDYFDIIFIDEAHHSTANSYTKIVNYFKPKEYIGLTATPFRLDGNNIEDFYKGNIVYKLGRNDAIDKGYLVPFIYIGVYDKTNLKGVRQGKYYYNKKDLDKKLIIPERDRLIVEQFKKHLRYRQTIGFCSSVKYAKHICDTFNKIGFKSAVISHKTKNREKIRKKFEKKEIQILFTIDIFNEGVDIPNIEGLMFLRPTISKTIFEQQLGRGLRRKSGKNDVIVLDFVMNHKNVDKIGRWVTGLRDFNKSINKEKPIFEFNGCKVKFEPELIDIMQLAEPYTKEDCIRIFYEDKKNNKRPSEHYKLYNTILNYWGTWNNFLREIKEPVYRGKTKDDIIIKYKKLKIKLGRNPLRHEVCANSVMKKFWNNYADLQTECGDKPNLKFGKQYSKNIIKKLIMKEYYKNRRPLRFREFKSKYPNIQYLIRRYGGYTKLLKELDLISGYSYYSHSKLPYKFII